MNHDDDTTVQHSNTERQLRRLVVPEPAAYAPDKRLDVIHEPDLDLQWEARNEHPARDVDNADRLARVKLSSTIEPGDLRVIGLVAELGAVKVLDYLEAAGEVENHWGFAIGQQFAHVDPGKVLEQAADRRIRFIILGDAEWPEQLAGLRGAGALHDRGGEPVGLWIRGAADVDQFAANAVAVVGSRAAPPGTAPTRARLLIRTTTAGESRVALGRVFSAGPVERGPGCLGLNLAALRSETGPTHGLGCWGCPTRSLPGHADDSAVRGAGAGNAFYPHVRCPARPTIGGWRSFMPADEGERQPGLRDVFARPNYRRLWTARTVSQCGDIFNFVALAGFLVVAVDPGPAFAINAASYAISALVLRGLKVPTTPEPLERRRLLFDVREGVRVLVGDRLLRALAMGQLLAALSAGATSALLVVLAEEHLGVTGGGYGTLIAAIGVGAALGPLVLLRAIRNPRRPVFVFGPFGLRGIVDLVLASVAVLPVAALALVVYGVGTSTGAVTFNSMLQAEAPERARGRIFASMDVLWQGGRFVSLAVGGLLADLYGITVVYYLGGALLLAAAATGLTATQRGRP